MKTLEEITDPVGRRTYSPDEEVARKAPAIICAVASRTFRLRAEMEKLRRTKPESLSMAEVEKLVQEFILPLPFEKELLSGDIQQVDTAFHDFRMLYGDPLR